MTSINIQKWAGGSEFEFTTISTPELNEGDRLVEMHIAAVCGSDRHTVSGRRAGACPSVLGHEGVGTIVAGPGVDKRIVFSVTSTCGQCVNCQRGLTAKCEQVLKVGHESYDSAWALSGTYASHIVLPAGVTVVEVPEEVSDEAASIAGCSVATVMATLEAAGEITGRDVFVNGLGMLGLVAVAAALARGARTVFTFDPSEERMAQALALGAQPLKKGREVEISLEFSGVSAGVRSAISTLGIGGTAVLAGSVAPAGDIGIDPEWLVRGWRTITGVHNYEPRHLQEAVDFLAAVSLPWEELLSGPISLEDLPQEFAQPHPGLRTLVKIN
ncbi:alcohol dehydrogenase catalytic domain-containing protein [Corynebacterium crudilactis]|uniref:alcohol dehydrogenase n=1 Tax=Corynebacterium crudilactis TaxID=1652495 RepID=A0A172QV12_9CORY|nr:alcohol dehydrogenase catalytic domain-containing protein [Corynebacterium crudilactis]ANE04537.1 dehydrogenase [Corynebacterium crudilactis]